MCFILRLAPVFVATASAVLLSALACIRNDSPISFRIACAKINSADSAPRAYSSVPPLDKATVPLSSAFTRQKKIDQSNKSGRCGFSSSLCHRPRSASEYPVTCFQGIVQGIRFSLQVSSGRDSVHVFLSNISTPSWRVSNLQVLVTQVLYDKHFVANIRSGLTPVMYCSFSNNNSSEQ